MSNFELCMENDNELKETSIDTEDVEVIKDYLQRLDDTLDGVRINITVRVIE